MPAFTDEKAVRHAKASRKGVEQGIVAAVYHLTADEVHSLRLPDGESCGSVETL